MKKTLKVVLLKDVPSLGKAGEVKDVAFGFAKNQLLPQRLATMATPKALEQAKRLEHKREKAHRRQTDRLHVLAQKLAQKTIIVVGRANESGKLYGKIQDSQLLEALTAQGLEGLEQHMIKKTPPIETVGEHIAFLELSKGTKVPFKVRVEPA